MPAFSVVVPQSRAIDQQHLTNGARQGERGRKRSYSRAGTDEADITKKDAMDNKARRVSKWSGNTHARRVSAPDFTSSSAEPHSEARPSPRTTRRSSNIQSPHMNGAPVEIPATRSRSLSRPVSKGTPAAQSRGADRSVWSVPEYKGSEDLVARRVPVPKLGAPYKRRSVGQDAMAGTPKPQVTVGKTRTPHTKASVVPVSKQRSALQAQRDRRSLPNNIPRTAEPPTSAVRDNSLFVSSESSSSSSAAPSAAENATVAEPMRITARRQPVKPKSVGAKPTRPQKSPESPVSASTSTRSTDTQSVISEPPSSASIEETTASSSAASRSRQHFGPSRTTQGNPQAQPLQKVEIDLKEQREIVERYKKSGLERTKKPQFKYNAEKVEWDGSDALLVSVEPGNCFSITDFYKFKVLRGVVSVFGRVLSALEGATGDAKFYHVSAPITNASPKFTALPIGDEGALKHAALDGPFREEMKELEESSRTTFVLLVNPSNPIGQLPKLTQIKLSNQKQADGFDFTLKSEDDIGPTENFPSPWRAIASGICKCVKQNVNPPRMLVSGSKGAGKSTFIRFLMNCLASQSIELFVLDADPGQPLFAPPGNVGLYQLEHAQIYVSSLQTLEPEVMYHLGLLSPTDDLAKYHQLIDALHRRYVEYGVTTELEGKTRSPLIVNTMGYMKGYGLEVLRVLLQSCGVDRVIHIGSETENSKSEFSAIIPTDVRVEYLPSVSLSFSGSDRTNAVDSRNAGLVYHLHQQLDSTWDDRALVHHDATVVKYSGPEQAVHGIVMTEGGMALADMAQAISGTVVGVNICDRETVQILRENLMRTPEMIPMVPAENPLVSRIQHPDHCHCIALAVIRNINARMQELYLVGPVPQELIERAIKDQQGIVLVRGKLELPMTEYIDPDQPLGIGGARFVDDSVPFLSNRRYEGAGSQVWKVRRNIKRRPNQ